MSQDKIIAHLINHCPVGELGQLIHDISLLCSFNPSDHIEAIQTHYE